MFEAPPLLAGHVFAHYPEALQTGSETSSWSQAQPGRHALKSLLEGPSFDRQGVLWCVDVLNGRILNIDKTGTFSVAVEYDGWPNGLKIREDGLVFIADYKHGIMTHEPGSGKVLPLLERAGVERFKGVNDLFFARNGDLYFTDQGLTGLHDPTGRVFRLAPGGRVDCVLDGIPSPNGLVMNLEEDALLLAVTRANAIWRVPLAGHGAAKVGNFIQLSGGVGPDGLALDADGGLWVAHAGLGCVWGFSATGEPRARAKLPAGLITTNVAFACDGSHDLYVTEAATATIYRFNAGVAGKPMASHQR